MRVSIEIDDSHEETSVIIRCKEMVDDVQSLANTLKKRRSTVCFLIGYEDDSQHILRPNEITYFQSTKAKVEVASVYGTFYVKEKLYELEEELSVHGFIRISKSTLANLHEMKYFESSFSGTLCVYFKNGEKAFVSRSYVSSIKETLNMNRRNQI